MSLENLSLEQRDELALLAQELSMNPATRKEMLRMTKKVRPDLAVPELEIEDYTSKAVEQANARVEQLERTIADKEAREDLSKRREALFKKGIAQTQEDIDAIEKIMLEKKIADHETAAEYYEYQQMMAAPTPSGYNPSAMSKFNLKPFMQNPVTGARDEAAKALSELRKNTRPIGI